MGMEDLAITGVANYYGPRTTSGKLGAQTPEDDRIIKSALWDFRYNDLPNHTGAAVSVVAASMQQVIPANATIVSCRLVVDTAFTSTSALTDLEIGLVDSAGGTINLTGLMTAAESTQTAIGTAGNVVTGAGALIGKTIGSTAGYLMVRPNTNDLLTGSGRVFVEYIYDK